MKTLYEIFRPKRGKSLKADALRKNWDKYYNIQKIIAQYRNKYPHLEIKFKCHKNKKAGESTKKVSI
jgi:hypothetical protein|tara:strand:- start:1060 stop:1260 length:201 start_codon:yes stop_codon:yes gene_type:complete